MECNVQGSQRFGGNDMDFWNLVFDFEHMNLFHIQLLADLWYLEIYHLVFLDPMFPRPSLYNNMYDLSAEHKHVHVVCTQGLTALLCCGGKSSTRYYPESND